jgi:hypothetical protein
VQLQLSALSPVKYKCPLLPFCAVSLSNSESSRRVNHALHESMEAPDTTVTPSQELLPKNSLPVHNFQSSSANDRTTLNFSRCKVLCPIDIKTFFTTVLDYIIYRIEGAFSFSSISGLFCFGSLGGRLLPRRVLRDTIETLSNYKLCPH